MRHSHAVAREYGPDQAASTAKALMANGDYPGARAVLNAEKAKSPGPSVPEAGKAAPPAKGKKGGKVAKAKPVPKGRVALAKPSAPAGIRSVNFHMVDAQVYMFMGDFANAVESNKRAVALPRAPLSAYFNLAASHSALGAHAQALAALTLAGSRFGERAVIVTKIRHHVALEQTEAAQKRAGVRRLSRSCEDMHAGHARRGGRERRQGWGFARFYLTRGWTGGARRAKECRCPMPQRC